jgi:hypothetical protein
MSKFRSALNNPGRWTHLTQSIGSYPSQGLDPDIPIRALQNVSATNVKQLFKKPTLN